ncbi:MAG: radical SAM protein [Candidatus Bathyarchaeota archaeon]
MPISPSLFRVGLLLTDRCNVACGHCWFSCGPDRTETMPQATAEKAIDQSKGLGAHWVSFTGGEPFLEPRLLLGLVRYASEKGFYTEVVTNCSWATTTEAAAETLRPLSEAGLTALNMSVDDFHQEHIPLERVRHCFSAVKMLGVKPVFMVATRNGSRITAGSLSNLMGDPDIQVLGEPRKPNPSALAMETPFTPIGRGGCITPDAVVELLEAATIRCESALADIGVTPGGDVLPCCGPLGCREDAVLGNLRDESLEQILARAWKDDRLTRIRDGFQASGGYASRCHACYRHFGEV